MNPPLMFELTAWILGLGLVYHAPEWVPPALREVGMVAFFAVVGVFALVGLFVIAALMILTALCGRDMDANDEFDDFFRGF